MTYLCNPLKIKNFPSQKKSMLNSIVAATVVLPEIQTQKIIKKQETVKWSSRFTFNNDKKIIPIDNHLKKIKTQLKKELLTNVASLRNTILKYEKVKNMILSQLLDISKKFLSPTLLKYLLSRFIPYMHSLQENYFDSTLFYLLGEMLNYIVMEMNIMGNLQVFQRVSSQDIF